MAFPEQPACEQTISILRALILGADGACVSLNLGSILLFAGAFIGGVVALQFISRRILVGRRRATPTPTKSDPMDVSYDGGPIKSARRWRSGR